MSAALAPATEATSPDAYSVMFEDAVEIVLEAEGVLSDDPRDAGGLTKYGISKAAHPDLDIASLTRAQAIAIYHKEYWLPLRCDELPWVLALPLFDCGVNQGVATAAKLLQGVLRVVEDGIVGRQTLAAIARCDLKNVLPRFQARRALRYAQNGEFATFGEGWNDRLHTITIEACLG